MGYNIKRLVFFIVFFIAILAVCYFITNYNIINLRIWEYGYNIIEYLIYDWSWLGVVVGVFLGWGLERLSKRIDQPKLETEFFDKEPCLYLNRYLRLNVYNKGRSIAKNCTAKFSFTEADSEKWRENEKLHWEIYNPNLINSGDVNKIYSPVDIAASDYEVLDVFYYSSPTAPFTNAKPTPSIYINVYAFPAYEHGNYHPKISTYANLQRYKLEPGKTYKAEITAFCDNGSPSVFEFYFKIKKEESNTDTGTYDLKLYVGKTKTELKNVETCKL